MKLTAMAAHGNIFILHRTGCDWELDDTLTAHRHTQWSVRPAQNQSGLFFSLDVAYVLWESNVRNACKPDVHLDRSV